MATLILDTECYPNFWLASFKRLEDGVVLHLEKSERKKLDVERLERLIRGNRIITFNGQSYDMPMVWAAIRGASCATLKRINDTIINGRVRWWEVESVLQDFLPNFVRIPRTDHIDLIEPQPNPVIGLKALNGRLHGKKMQDLPYEPDRKLTPAEMDEVIRYCGNDLDATELLFKAIKEPLELREALAKKYGLADLRSKSDSQVGEAIVKNFVEKETKEKVQKTTVRPGTTFRYQVPTYIRFKTPAMQAVLERLRNTDFVVKSDGKVDLPKWLSEQKIVLGSSTFAMGIGGLHSTEANRSLYSDDERVLIDADVASYYPAIILGSGLFPKALGKLFLVAYRWIFDERLEGKKAKDKTRDKGLKIALNGIFGKLLSIFSILYAPHLGITVTLTGQLALLMLIETAVLAGIDVVSGNTDGVLFSCPREHFDGFIQKDGKASERLAPSFLADLTDAWEQATSFKLEFVEYRSIHNLSVNAYFAIKEDGGHKRKGPFVHPWATHPDDKDMRTQLMTNPSMAVCSDAVLAFLKDGVPIESTIRNCTDVRDFVTVVAAQGGATWRDEYLGKVVRYIWSTDGDPIIKVKGHHKTGIRPKVPKTDGCRPVMELPDDLPDDIDYDRYIREARSILVDVGAVDRPPPPLKVPLRSLKKAPRILVGLAVLA